jgi:hypothetical protein
LVELALLDSARISVVALQVDVATRRVAHAGVAAVPLAANVGGAGISIGAVRRLHARQQLFVEANVGHALLLGAGVIVVATAASLAAIVGGVFVDSDVVEADLAQALVYRALVSILTLAGAFAAARGIRVAIDGMHAAVSEADIEGANVGIVALTVLVAAVRVVFGVGATPVCALVFRADAQVVTFDIRVAAPLRGLCDCASKRDFATAGLRGANIVVVAVGVRLTATRSRGCGLYFARALFASILSAIVAVIAVDVELALRPGVFSGAARRGLSGARIGGVARTSGGVSRGVLHLRRADSLEADK